MKSKLCDRYLRVLTAAGLLSLLAHSLNAQAQLSSGKTIAFKAQKENRRLYSAVSSELGKARSGRGIDRDVLLKFLEKMPQESKEISGEERKELSRFWQDVADLVYLDEGQSDLYVESLKTALSFDPENLEIRRELENQRQRQEIYRRRIEAAAAHRKQKGGSK